MRVTLYNEPSGGVGGAEYSTGVLAQALAAEHEVEVVHHHGHLTADALTHMFGLDVGGVRFRRVPREEGTFGTSPLPWRKHREMRQWHATLSEGCDVFVNLTHTVPPFCHAPLGLLYVLFPMVGGPHLWPWQGTLSRVRRGHAVWEWKQRLRSYQWCAADSAFSRDWTRRRWDTDCEVVYPPADTREPANAVKEDLVLSVGRFGPMKRQYEMARTFRELSPTGWTFVCAGGRGESPAEQDYFAGVQSLAGGAAITLTANLDLEGVRGLFARAKIFWHAAGFGVDAEAQPEFIEHFGIATVQAMAAGCVPVVFAGGGQREIVQHGVNGLLWSTLEELAQQTRRLLDDEAFRARLAMAARQRAKAFGHELYAATFKQKIAQLTARVGSSGKRLQPS